MGWGVTPRMGIGPNVDLWSGAIYCLLGIPGEMFSAMFAVGRIPGWVVHAMEQEASAVLLRPRLRYDGPVGSSLYGNRGARVAGPTRRSANHPRAMMAALVAGAAFDFALQAGGKCSESMGHGQPCFSAVTRAPIPSTGSGQALTFPLGRPLRNAAEPGRRPLPSPLLYV